ncbi:hypothetical protein BH10CYA1_BH10CYA1_04730 [soil metagenome]
MNNTEYSSIIKTLEIIRAFSFGIDMAKCCEAAEEVPSEDESTSQAA